MVRLEITSADLAPNALRRWAEETPEQILLHHVDGRVLSYGDAARMCDAWAGGFHRRGIDSGSVVGIFVSDSFDCASAWLAVTSAGMIAVPMNTAHMGRMLRHVLATARMRAVVASADLVGRLSEASVESDLTDVIVHDAEWSGGRVGDVAAVGLREFLSGTLSVPPFHLWEYRSIQGRCDSLGRIAFPLVLGPGGHSDERRGAVCAGRHVSQFRHRSSAICRVEGRTARDPRQV